MRSQHTRVGTLAHGRCEYLESRRCGSDHATIRAIVRTSRASPTSETRNPIAIRPAAASRATANDIEAPSGASETAIR
jgi:hypothetical protein